jgi:hypothetical protein
LSRKVNYSLPHCSRDYFPHTDFVAHPALNFFRNWAGQGVGLSNNQASVGLEMQIVKAPLRQRAVELEDPDNGQRFVLEPSAIRRK